jgi:hypothetical protein
MIQVVFLVVNLQTPVRIINGIIEALETVDGLFVQIPIAVIALELVQGESLASISIAAGTAATTRLLEGS